MPDLTRNVVGNTVAGAVIGVVGALNRWIVHGIPFIYDAVVKTLGRWGEPVFAIALSLVLDIVVGPRVQPLENLRVPSRLYIYGIYRIVEEAMDMVTGKGFAAVNGDGSIKTDPSDEIRAIYMQKGDSVVQVASGSATATIGPRRYVAVGAKRVYYFEAPYELPAATAPASK